MGYPFGPMVVLVGRTVTGTDRFGNDTYTATSVTVQAQAFDPGGSVETSNSDDQVITSPTLYLPPGTDISAVDACQVGGVTYEVDGDPAVWGPNPFTGSPLGGVAVKLKRVTG